MSLVREREAGFGIPDFIDFVDNGDGKATLNISPSDKDISGSYTFTLIAEEIRDDNDSETPLYTEKTFNINVLGKNDAPHIEYIGDKVAVVGETLKFDVLVEDNNQDDLNFEILNQQDLPSGISLTQKGGYGKASFEWKLLAADTDILDKTYPVTIRVTDSGNGSSEIFSDIQTFNINVRNSNTAPNLLPIPNLSPEGILTVKEAEILELQLTAEDSDNDEITYLAKNLPQNASLDAKTGKLTWKSDYSQAGLYENITIIATDGNKQSEKTFDIVVENTNRAPVIIPLPTQIARENEYLRFSLNAVDYDVEGVVFSPITNLPEGATFDSRTGEFVWKPDYNQSGQYKLTFEVSDAGGAIGKRDVDILITDTSRNPELKVSNRGVALGETLNFTLNGLDPDEKAQLTYFADILPEGATLNTETGEFKWTPNPGQVDDYSINFSVSDGISTVTENVLVKVALNPENPTVNLDLTPSFAVTPNQSVIVTAFADGFAEIDNITVKVDGETKILDRFGRFEFIPTTAGKVFVEAIATDADGRVGRNSTVIKVRNPLDNNAPIVELDSAVNARSISEITDIVGEVSDVNLDSWKLEIAEFGENDYKAIAIGDNTVSDEILAQIDPNKLNNGFYQLRLTATDISGRTSTTETVVEINSTAKTSAYTRKETDLTYNFSSLPLNITRIYNSLDNTWRFSTDTNIQTNVPLTGREELGVYEPYRVGTRLYLTTPTGERVGFTFTPQKQEISGLTYYSPQWVADAGVEYSLNSADANLTLAGNRFYELNTGFAYNPASGDFDGAEFTLTAADGTQYLIDSKKGITEQIAPNGINLVYSDSGITSSTGETVQFVNDEQGFLKEIIAPDGTKVVYDYQDGNLVAARNLSTGDVRRYGYNDSLLTLVTGNPGTDGKAIAYRKTPQITDIQRDLGGVVGWNGSTVNGNLTSGIEQYTFGLRSGEIESTTTGIVLVSAEVTGGGLPSIAGSTLVATDGNYALFAIDTPGLNLISLTPSLSHSLTLKVAGDVNSDGAVDGVDSELVNRAIANNTYIVDYDFNRDGVVNAADMQILGSNYGFAANRAPIVTASEVLTHTDLQAFIELDKLATDPEGDPIYFRLANPEQGSVSFTPDGKSVIFTPEEGYFGDASFDLIADDGFSAAGTVTIRVDVSDAPLINLDIVNRSPRLDKGESTQLVVVGDFRDQDDVILPASYVNFVSENGLVADINEYGVLSGISDGVEIVSVEKNGISAVTAVRVGDLGVPTNEAEFNVALAESQGLNVYPGAVTLVEGVERQILVGIEGEIDSPDLRNGSTGTRYFASNSDVLQVTEDGLITALDEGVANVTVFHGAAEYVLPVRVELPHLNEAILGTDGGAVQAADGSMVMIAPGALQEDTTVSIKQITKDDFAIDFPEDNFTFAGGFEFNIGENPLDIPAQIAVPNIYGIEAGKEVFFMREVEFPDETGSLKTIWLMEESGIVGEDGMIRTSSLPWVGATVTGKVAVAIPVFNYVVAPLAVKATSALAALPLYTFNPVLGVGFALGVGIALGVGLYYGASLFNKKNNIIEVISVPVVGLPYTTPAGVQLNLDQLTSRTTPTTVIEVPPPSTINDNTPVVEKVALDFDTEGAFIRVDGRNFGDDSNNLLIDIQYGTQEYELRDIILKEPDSTLLFRLPETIPYSEDVKIHLERKQKPKPKLPLVPVEEPDPVPVPIPLPHCIETAITVNPLSDNVRLIQALNPEQIVEEDGVENLLEAIIPIGDPDKRDVPRYVGTTSNASLAYIPLTNSAEVAVIDVVGRRALDINRYQDGINGIKLRNASGASPTDIVVHPNNKYAYIADRNSGQIFVLDINPNSLNYNEHVDTIKIGDAPNGIRQIEISSDGKKLYATVSVGKNSSKGGIAVININPDDTPEKPNLPSPKKWHKQIGFIETNSGIEGISATPYNDKMIFTNRTRDGEGFGVITVTSNDPNQFAAKTSFTNLGLGSNFDRFDVNEAVSVTMMRDSETGEEYAFVAGRNGRMFGAGIPSIDGPKSGSNVGIIKDPLGEKPELVAATNPVPMGLTTDVSITSDNKYLYATYPGFNSTFVFDVDQIIETVNNTEAKKLSTEPLDRLNDDIGIATNILSSVDEDASPLFTGVSYGLDMASTLSRVNLDVAEQDTLRPTFRWNFNNESQPEHDVCQEHNPPEDDEIEEVNLYVSVFPQGEGLLPEDRWSGLEIVEGVEDYNPNRILTARWEGKNNGTWTWNGDSLPGSSKDIFQLPEELTLTAGQQYYWTVVVKDKNGREYTATPGDENSRFTTPLAKLENQQNDTFSSVTVLTNGVEFGDDSRTRLINNQLKGMAEHLFYQGASVMEYNPQSGRWDSIGFGQIEARNPEKGEQLVLLADWMKGVDQKSRLYNAGFAEAAADTLFASLVRLDQTQNNGGAVGENGNVYDQQGKLIRKQGSILDSPLHFVGVGQGAVVNSEIVQRLGTFFPNAGGSNGNNHDIHVTTIDPYQYNPDEKLSFGDIEDPYIRTWENVTYADNYYQQSSSGDVRQGAKFVDADWNIELTNFEGFDKVRSIGDSHTATSTWYAGTSNLSVHPTRSNEFPLIDGGIDGQIIKRRLGDLDLDASGNPKKPTWYTADHINANFERSDEAPWEGIGTGWFHSIAGGGYKLRPYSFDGGKASIDDIEEAGYQIEDVRTLVSEENTPIPSMRGDYAVPTLFNGNFDAISYQNSSQYIPGWYSDSKTNNQLKQSALADVTSKPGAIQYSNNAPNYALRLGGNTTEVVHDWFVMPDWGNLRFDVHAPNKSGKLDVKLTTADGLSKTTTINLDENADFAINLNNRNNIADITQIYTNNESKIGFGRKGFETFQLKLHLPDSQMKNYRGRPVQLEFSLDGGSEVFIDNVFFKSDYLKFGNPTEARWNSGYPNNLLLEKPQYAVSYNADTKIANWVGWKVDKTWVTRPQPQPGQGLIETPEFIADPDLLSDGFTTLFNGNIFTGLGMDRGHLASNGDKRRHPKDQLATYLTTNLIAQSIDNNRFFEDKSIPIEAASAWNNIERRVFQRAQQGQELYIFSGAFGNNTQPQRKTNVSKLLKETNDEGLFVNKGDTKPNKLSSQQINIPKWTWKSIIVLEQPGAEITSNTEIFTFLTPNSAEGTSPNNTKRYVNNEPPVSWPQPHPFNDLFGGNRFISSLEEWRNPNTWRISLQQLESLLNQNVNLSQGQKFDFLSDVPLSKNILDNLKNQGRYGSNNPPSAFLLAEVDSRTSFSEDLSENIFSILPTFSNTLNTFGHVKVDSEARNENSIVSGNIPVLTKVSAKTINPAILKIDSDELSTSQITYSGIDSSQVTVIKPSPFQVTIFDNSIREVTVDKLSSQIALPQLNTTQVDITKLSAPEIDISEFNSTEIGILQNNFSKIPLSSSISLQQLLSSHNLPLEITNTFKDNPLNLTLEITDLPTGQLAEAQVTEFTDQGIPNGGKILIDHNANGLGWFIDTTPLDHSEFSHTLTDTALLATADSEAHGKYDLLTTILHEFGHLAGFISGYNEFDRRIQTINGKKTFVADNFTATLSPDGSHLDSEAHPYDLMNTTLRPGVRKLPSLLNLQILDLLRSGESDPTLAQLTAPLTSDPLIGINNGTFDTQETWSTRGAANIIQGQAVLTEESRLNSSFTQNFIIPDEAKYLQFTILESDLEGRRKEEEGRSDDSTSSVFPLPSSLSNAPGDAFEVALLNNQNLSLAGTAAGLTQTDALLNIQHDGDSYFSDKVNISGTETSGNQIDLNVTRTVTIDISHINANTEATLYFDLLGFGDKESRVVIDNVRILTDDILIPTANNDTAITNQGQPVTINVLDNDTDADGTINPSTIQIESAPVNGNITINDDGTITYNPSGNAAADTFTYTVKDNDNNTSNTETVNITINNSAPSIKEVIVEPNLAEGIAATFSANATDEGEVTYSWNFGDNTPALNGQSVTHTFLDNGTYTATLTVTDSNGASTVETLTLNVNNIAPTVTAGENQTTIENQVITFSGNYTDPGILDTHSIRWEFGDGSVLVSEGVREGESEGVNYLNPTHTYVNPGTYTATLTVTDKDGGTRSDTLQVQVNNTAPTITEITGDTNLKEGAISEAKRQGRNANLTAAATPYSAFL